MIIRNNYGNNMETYAQSRSRFTFSTALALPFSFSAIRRIDSSIVRRSASAFRPRSATLCRATLSSVYRRSSSSVGGTASGGFFSKEEVNEGGRLNEDNLDVMSSLVGDLAPQRESTRVSRCFVEADSAETSLWPFLCPRRTLGSPGSSCEQASITS